MSSALPAALMPSLAQRVTERLSDKLVGDFQRNGAIVIRQLLSPDELTLLREGIAAKLGLPSAAIWRP